MILLDPVIDKVDKDIMMGREGGNQPVIAAEIGLVTEVFPQVNKFTIEGNVVAFKVDGGWGNAVGLACEALKVGIHGLAVGNGCTVDQVMEQGGADTEGSLIGIMTCHLIVGVVLLRLFHRGRTESEGVLAIARSTPGGVQVVYQGVLINHLSPALLALDKPEAGGDVLNG